MRAVKKTYSILVDDINNGNQLASIRTECNERDSPNLHKPCVSLHHNQTLLHNITNDGNTTYKCWMPL